MTETKSTTTSTNTHLVSACVSQTYLIDHAGILGPHFDFGAPELDTRHRVCSIGKISIFLIVAVVTYEKAGTTLADMGVLRCVFLAVKPDFKPYFGSGL